MNAIPYGLINSEVNYYRTQVLNDRGYYRKYQHGMGRKECLMSAIVGKRLALFET